LDTAEFQVKSKIPTLQKNNTMRSNVDLLSASPKLLKTLWLSAIAAILIIGVVNAVAGSVGFGILSLLIAGPLGYGQARYFLMISRGENPAFEELFSGFKRFVQTMVIGLLVALVVLAGCILLIVPGIIAAIGLSMAYYVAIDRPELDAPDVLRASWDLVWKQGNTGKVFGFMLLSVLLSIGGILCFGVGLLFTTPMILVGQGLLYDELKGQQPDLEIPA
jgi:uncharacterized membrane protein